MTFRTVASGALLAIASFGCARRSDPSPAAASGVLPVSPPSSPAQEAPVPGSPPSASAPGELSPADFLASAKTCRAIALRGRVTTAAGQALEVGAVLDGVGWLDLAKGSDLTVKHATTARELRFTGPGRIAPCDRGEERFLIASGRVQTETWAGARPGAEVILGTPYGAIRYGDARLDVRVDARGLGVVSTTGDAWLDRASGEAETEKVSSGGRGEWRGPPLDVKALVARCESAAETADARARAVLTPPDLALPLGARAAEHVQARKAARAACVIAAATLGTVKMGPDRDALARAVEAAEVRWRAVPRTAHPFRKVESR